MAESLRRFALGVCGQNGSGKSSVCTFFAQFGFKTISLSDEIRKELVSRGLPETRENLIEIGNALRQQHGPGILGERVSQQLDSKQSYVIDSIRHPKEVEALRQIPGFQLISIHADAAVRLARLQARARPGDAVSATSFAAADSTEARHSNPAGQQLDETMGCADVQLTNNGTQEEFNRALREFAAKIGVYVTSE